MKLKYALIAAVFAAINVGGWYWWRAYQLDHSQDDVIIAAASIYDMDPALIKAVIWRESRFNPDARGAAGELGLMQIRDAAAGEWAAAEGIVAFHHTHMVSAKSNVLAGTWYLKRAIGRYQDTDDPVAYGLAEYNAGRSNVLKWKKAEADTNGTAFIQAIGFPSTKDYVTTIKARREKYRSFGKQTP